MPAETGTHASVGDLQRGTEQELGLNTGHTPTGLLLYRKGREVLGTGSSDFPRQGKVVGSRPVQGPVRRRRRWGRHIRAWSVSLF